MKSLDTRASREAGSPGRRPTGFKRRSELKFGLLMMAPAFGVLLFVMLVPVLLAIQSSFFRIDTITRAETFVGLRNYENLIKDPAFWDAFKRTLFWVFGAVTTQLVLGVAVALILDSALRGRNLVRGLMLFPYLVPAIVAVLVWRWIFNDLVGVANYVFVDVLGVADGPLPWFHPNFSMLTVILMSAWKYTPFWAVLILARLQVVPTDLYEAAQIDGASSWQRFRHITVPWIAPVVIVLVILRSIWAFNEFDMVYLPAEGGPLSSTTTISVYIRQLAFGVLNLGAASAVALTMLIVVVALTTVYFAAYRRAERNLS